ncbi:toprim domain-containing protein [Succinivibrio dextrinosolvens]|jgi:hypothetical protein|uniref:toprim domain-containing protein n=1 Tax=Succinivibrio dextrinosolvens TaxID=83771 RepID=UPI00241DD9B8|nr:toprim domain-containing protein [Succinivibrio dextrinosolvens]MBE6423121.1 hypothetical protein [Succinivibrio dextrinosolvens]
MQSFTREVVMAAASGRYNEIAMRFVPQLEKAIKRAGRHVADPFRPGSKDGFRVYKDFNMKGKMIFNNNWGSSNKTIDLFELMQLTGVAKDFPDVLEQVGEFLGCPRTGYHIKGTGYDNLTSAQKSEQRKAIEEARKAAKLLQEQSLKEEQERYRRGEIAINKQLETCIPLSVEDIRCKPVWDYFENRGLGMLKYAPKETFKDLFYAPLVPYYDDDKVQGYYDTLCSVIRRNGKLWSLHRIFLQNGNKAPVEKAKKVMSPVCNGSDSSLFIRLGNVPTHGIIGIAEGIETALACYCGIRIPTWSAISATFLETFTPPKNVRAVIIFADKDKSGAGQSSAKKLKERLLSMGIKAFICLPKSEIPVKAKGVDWLDELQKKGVFGFPDPVKVLDFIQEQLNK